MSVRVSVYQRHINVPTESMHTTEVCHHTSLALCSCCVEFLKKPHYGKMINEFGRSFSLSTPCFRAPALSNIYCDTPAPRYFLYALPRGGEPSIQPTHLCHIFCLFMEFCWFLPYVCCLGLCHQVRWSIICYQGPSLKVSKNFIARSLPCRALLGGHPGSMVSYLT